MQKVHFLIKKLKERRKLQQTQLQVKLQLRKDLKKGTYKVTVKVTASGDETYTPLTSKVVFTVNVI